MANFSTLASNRVFHPCLVTSTFESAGVQIAIRPTAYSYSVPGSARPAASSFCGYSMSAEKNRSKGAPFCICEKKFPLDPYVTFTFVPACLSNCADNSPIANFKSAAAATRISWACARASLCGMRSEMTIKNKKKHLRPFVFARVTSHQSQSYSENHHFRRLDQRRRPFARLQAQLFRRVRRNDRGNVLLADRQRDLGQQPAEFERHHATDELVSPADLAKISPPRFNVPALQLPRNQAINLALGHAVVAAGCLHGFNFSVVDPLLQGGIADAQNIRRLARRKQLLHGTPPANPQNTALRTVLSIRFYTTTNEPGTRFRRCGLAAAAPVTFQSHPRSKAGGKPYNTVEDADGPQIHAIREGLFCKS